MRLSLFRPPAPALLAAALLATLALPAAACPDWRLNGQTDTISGGQARAYSYQAGGAYSLSNCPMPGTGRVNAAPHLTLSLRGQAPGADLSFRVEAPCDTVLLVNDAGAQWHFNDDTNGLNPAITLRGARDGVYDVWVGTFGNTTCQAQLFVQSGATPPPPPPAACPDWRLSGLPLALQVGLGSARTQATVRTGGGVQLSNCPEPGHGQVSTAPQVELSVRGLTGQALDLAVTASCDTVLLVNDARGQWHFNDDRQGLNPGLTLQGAADGVYDVWIGTFGNTACDATLTVQAAGAAPPPPPPACPDPNLTGAVQSQSFASLRAPLGMPVRAGGAARLGDCAGLPGSGYADARPQVSLDLGQVPAGGTLEIGATAACDTVLLVRDPAGRWNFNDDSDGLNPRLTLAPAAGGRYGIWLGTFGPTPCDATLQLRTIAAEPTKPGLPVPPPQPNVLPDPGNLMGFRNQVGQTLTFSVTGAAGGSVWGDGIYTDDSSLARAAVHAGALTVGQTGLVRVTILSGQSSYGASTRNGVSTSAYGSWSGSYRIDGLVPEGPGGALIGVYDTPYGALTLTRSGARVTGTYPYNEGRIEGVLDGQILTGTWHQINGRGRLRFVFGTDFRQFIGTWGNGEAEPTNPGWEGTRRN